MRVPEVVKEYKRIADSAASDLDKIDQLEAISDSENDENVELGECVYGKYVEWRYKGETTWRQYTGD